MKRVPVDRLLALLGAAQEGRGRVPLADAARLLGVRAHQLPDVVEALCVIELPPHGDCLDLALDGDDVVFAGLPMLASSAPLTTLDGALLFTALATLRRSSGRRVGQLCTEAAKKVRAGLGEPAGSEADARSTALAWSVDQGASTDTLTLLQDAAESRCVVILRYWNASRDVVEARRAGPLNLCQHTGRWYLGALDLDRGAHRWFRLERILGVTATTDPFVPQSPRSPEREWLYDPPSEPAELVVRFTPSLQRRVRGELADIWAGSADGGIRLRGSTTETMIRRLFALGDGWEILAPESARAMVRCWCGMGG